MHISHHWEVGLCQWLCFYHHHAHYYIAETTLSYLLKNKDSKVFVWLLRLLIMADTFYGSIKTAELACTVGDIGVGIMAWLNIVAILLLRKPALDALKDYQRQKRAGADPVYRAADHGVKNADQWS
jgi:AGCS family alanine or glycine:cation symporter